MSGRFIQIVFAIGYLAMLCLALFLFSGCSQPAPKPSPTVTTSEPVKLKVELGESSGSQLNATVTKTGRQLQTTVTKNEYGTTEVTLKFRPGEDEASERETRYTSISYGHSLTIEKLNWNGKPRELKTWVSKDNKSEPTLLYRHATFTLNGKIQWQEFYRPDGSVRQRTTRTKNGGFQNLCFDEKGQAWVLVYNKDEKVVERFDYYGDERSQVKHHVKWDPLKEHVELESRSWYANGTLECERKRDSQGFNHVRWYRKNGVLKIVEKHLHNEDRDMDSWEEYYKPDGKTVWRKTQYIDSVRTNLRFAENGTVEFTQRIDGKTGATVSTLMHPNGSKAREIEWKRVKIRFYDGKQIESAQRVRADTMDQEGRLASRFLFDLDNGNLREMQQYRNGALVERKILDDKDCVIRIEEIAADGTVAKATEIAEADRKALSEAERHVEYINERSYNVDDTLPDHCVDMFRSE